MRPGEPFAIGPPAILGAPSEWVADDLLLHPSRLADTYTRPVDRVELRDVQHLARPEPVVTLEDLHEERPTGQETRRLRHETKLEDQERERAERLREANASDTAWKKHWKTRRERRRRVTHGETAERERVRRRHDADHVATANLNAARDGALARALESERRGRARMTGILAAQARADAAREGDVDD